MEASVWGHPSLTVTSDPATFADDVTVSMRPWSPTRVNSSPTRMNSDSGPSFTMFRSGR